MKLQIALTACLAGAALLGCRGGRSEDPPFHLIPDMQWQQHRGAQSESKIFADRRSNRVPDAHSLARGRSRVGTDDAFLKESDAIYKGVDTAGSLLDRIPLEVTSQLLDRGQERFNIYCAPCHDKSGSGHGLVSQHAPDQFGDLPNFAEKPELQADKYPDGKVFRTISLGEGRMPSYASQIPERDRWAIVAWFRVLQQSQHAAASKFSGQKFEPAESEKK
jgi:mono/diheme cytochrome c family protein